MIVLATVLNCPLPPRRRCLCLLSTALLLCVLAIGHVGGIVEYQNELTMTLDFECPNGEAIFKVRSTFHSALNGASINDRRWHWECRKVYVYR